MKIFVIGGGGREHAIIKTLVKSKRVDEIYCASTNPAIAKLAKLVPISTMDFDSLVSFAKEKEIDLTIASMDDTLVAGIVDKFNENGLRIFGPDKKAAIIEGSKAYSKELMKKYNIPTASYETFSSYDEALAYLDKVTFPIVIKADGLALGKGVVICKDFGEAKTCLEDNMLNAKFGKSGEKVVIEEFMTGSEVSILCFCDGDTIVPMLSAKDHKRAFDGNKGPNTGGMGTISPCKEYTKEIAKTCYDTIFKPTLDALKQEGRPFVGVLFFGLMLTKDGPKVIEYNARFGDPETQVVLPRLKTDLLDIIDACIDKKLSSINIEWEDFSTCCIILASGGYPESYEKGYEILGLEKYENLEDIFIYHAGTALKDNKIVSNGGRVLGIMAKADNLDNALEKSYNALKDIKFKDCYYRKDIGKI